MRKLLTISFIICHLSFSEALAQVSFGLKGGLQLATMELNSSAFSSSNRVGFFAGPTLLIKTPIVPLSVDVAAYYAQHHQEVADERIKQQHIVLPAHLRLGASVADQIGIFLFTGPQLSFNVGKSVVEWTDGQGINKQYVQQNTLLGLNMGIGAFVSKLEFTLLYHLPLGRAGDFTWEALRTQLQDESWEHAKSSTNAWRLSVAYYF